MAIRLLEQFLKNEIKLILENNFKEDQVKAAVDMLSTLTKSSPFAGKAYIAGGWVRDSVLGRVSKDIDITVEMENGGVLFAEWLSKKIGSKPPVIFERFGTAMVPLSGVKWKGVDLSGLELEFVQTRTETYTPEGGRKPQVGFGSIKDDVERRDFTVNALLFDLTNNKIIDLVGGLEDIKKGIIRTPLDPDVIFNEDPLRMLRAVRFAGRYNWNMDPSIERSIKNNVHLLGTISRERVRDELLKIIHGSLPKEGLKFLMDTGLWDFVFPGIKINSISTDVVFEAIEASAGSDILFLALLGYLSGKDIVSSARNLKLDNNQIKKISGLLSAFEILESEDNFNDDYKVRKAGAIASKANAIDELSEILSFFGKKESEGFGEQPKIFFSGGDLMSMFNLKPGPQISILTNLQKEAWFEDPYVTSDDVLYILKEFIAEDNE